MFNSSFNLVKFSPLRTPEIQKVAAKRQSGEDGYVSSSSVVSSVTHEILGISQSIQKKLSSENKTKKTGIDSRGERSSSEEDELFITQRFSPQINKKETRGDKNKTKKRASVQSCTLDGFTEHDSNNNSPVKTQTKETKMKLQVTGKEKHEKVQQSKKMTKQGSSPLSNKSSLDADKNSPHKDSASKKGTKKQEQTVSRRSKTHIVSSSSDNDSGSSSDSEIDEAKCRILMERLRAKAETDDNSESESDNEIIHKPSQKHTKEQVKDKFKKDEHTKAKSQINFSQDLFSPQSDDGSDGGSVDAVRKSGRKSAKQQKLSQKRDKSYSKVARKQDSEIDSDVEAEDSMSEDSNDQHKENENIPEEEATVQDSSVSDSDSDSSMSDANDTVIESKKTDTTRKSKLSSSHSEDDSGSDLSDVADKPVKKMAKSSDTFSDSGERDSVVKLTQNANIRSPKTSSSDSESNSDSDTQPKTGKETDFTSLKNQSSDSEDDAVSVSSDTGKKSGTSHEADNSEAPGSDSDSDIGNVSDSNPEMSNKTDKDKTTIISNSELPSPRRSTRQTQRAETPFRSTRQSKITEHCPPAASEAKRRKMRYKPPDGFDIDDDVDKYATQEEVNGKQIWLIQTPVDFDINTLDNRKIKLEGVQTLHNKTKSEKQYEVFGRCSKDNQQDAGCSVVYDKDGKPLLDAGISGQIQVLDWIPGIPPVEIDVPAQDKHRVPDNLRVRFVPFGSESPERVDDPVKHESKKHGSKRKHDRSLEESKKKKKKSKRDSRGEMN